LLKGKVKMTNQDARALKVHDCVTLVDDKSAQGEIINITPTTVHIKWIDGPVGIYYWGGTAMKYIIKKEGPNV
jgi:hypothetical protein